MIVIVAGGVFSSCHHQNIVIGFLGPLCQDISFSLFGYRVEDDTFLSLEVVGHLVGLITIFSFRKHGFAYPFVLNGIQHTPCVQRTAVHVYADIFSGELHGLVL